MERISKPYEITYIDHANITFYGLIHSPNAETAYRIAQAAVGSDYQITGVRRIIDEEAAELLQSLYPSSPAS